MRHGHEPSTNFGQTITRSATSRQRNPIQNYLPTTMGDAEYTSLMGNSMFDLKKYAGVQSTPSHSFGSGGMGRARGGSTQTVTRDLSFGARSRPSLFEGGSMGGKYWGSSSVGFHGRAPISPEAAAVAGGRFNAFQRLTTDAQRAARRMEFRGAPRSVKVVQEFISGNSMNISKWGGGGLAVMGGVSAYNNVRDGRYARAGMGLGLMGVGMYMYSDPRVVESLAKKVLNNGTVRSTARNVELRMAAAKRAARVVQNVARVA